MLIKKIITCFFAILLVNSAILLFAIEIPLGKNVKQEMFENFSTQLDMDVDEFVNTVIALKKVDAENPQSLEELIGASAERVRYLVFKTTVIYGLVFGSDEQKQFCSSLAKPYKILDEELKIANQNLLVFQDSEEIFPEILKNFMETPELFLFEEK